MSVGSHNVVRSSNYQRMIDSFQSEVKVTIMKATFSLLKFSFSQSIVLLIPAMLLPSIMIFPKTFEYTDLVQHFSFY